MSLSIGEYEVGMCVYARAGILGCWYSMCFHCW